jgi:hypothetical protein
MCRAGCVSCGLCRRLNVTDGRLKFCVVSESLACYPQACGTCAASGLRGELGRPLLDAGYSPAADAAIFVPVPVYVYGKGDSGIEVV